MTKILRFENLVDINGETVTVDVPDDFDENSGSFADAGNRGKAFGARVRAAAKWDPKMAKCLANVNQCMAEFIANVRQINHLREVKDLNEVGRIGATSGEKLTKAFGDKNGHTTDT